MTQISFSASDGEKAAQPDEVLLAGKLVLSKLRPLAQTQCPMVSGRQDFPAGNIVWNRFTGPGKVALQSMYFHMEGGE